MPPCARKQSLTWRRLRTGLFTSAGNGIEVALGGAHARGVMALQQGHLPVQGRQGSTGNRNREGDAQGFCVAGTPGAGGRGGLGHALTCQGLSPQPASSSRCKLSQSSGNSPRCTRRENTA
jgi:hypothetical protein